MTIEKRNIVEDKRTPGIKQAEAEQDRLAMSANKFSKERVTNERPKQKEPSISR